MDNVVRKQNGKIENFCRMWGILPSDIVLAADAEDVDDEVQEQFQYEPDIGGKCGTE